MLTPDIGAQFFRDNGEVVNAGGSPDKAKLLAAMARYGLVPPVPKSTPEVANTWAGLCP